MRDIKGCGLGLRDEFIFDILSLNSKEKPEWLEIIPENWIKPPSKYKKIFNKIANKYPLISHGVSLSIGSYESVNMFVLKQMKDFLDKYQIDIYSEHLSFSSLKNIQTHELLPLPMREEQIEKICEKIDIIQNYLKRELILENPTYYYSLESTMSETEFINKIFKQSGAKMLCDVNNIFINSFNHKFDPYNYIDNLDIKNIAYYHVAGHLKYRDDLLLDTHGAKVKNKVLDLLKYSLKKCKAPILLERDDNIPPLNILMKEVKALKNIYEKS